jgi:hypothetical protein
MKFISLTKETNMRVAKDFGKVRIVHLGDPMQHASDIIVEVMRGGAWERYAGYNSMSCDYAHTNAQEAAGRAIKMLAAEAAQFV